MGRVVRLRQDWPNPFNPECTLAFELMADADVDLKIYDLKGECVRSLIRKKGLEAGCHELHWDGRNETGAKLDSGIYLYRLVADDEAVTRRLVLAKK